MYIQSTERVHAEVLQTILQKSSRHKSDMNIARKFKMLLLVSSQLGIGGKKYFLPYCNEIFGIRAMKGGNVRRSNDIKFLWNYYFKKIQI